MHKLKIGLAIAKQENKNISELKRFLKNNSVDILLFPEGYLHSDNLDEARQLVKENNKWLITGMDDRRTKNKKYETAIVINPDGEIVGEHKKTSLTENEIKKDYSRGNSLKTINTDFGKIGISICYEIHFPEISRIYVVQGAKIIFNPIGTGMWHEQQYQQWTSVVSARASENKVFVLGCSHFNDKIPIAFAYAPKGECLIKERNKNKLVKVVIDFNKYPVDNKFRFSQRRPELYKELVK